MARMNAILLAGGLLVGSCGSGPSRRSPEYPPIPPERVQAAPETQGAAVTAEQVEEIRQVVRVGRDSVNECYETELERLGTKDLKGSVAVKIRIAPSGQVQEVEIGQSTLKVAAVHDCMLVAIKKWEFPKLEDFFWYSTTFEFSPAY